jgi:hypothetical protein
MTSDLVKSEMMKYTYPERWNPDWNSFPENYFQDFNSVNLVVASNIYDGVMDPVFTTSPPTDSEWMFGSTTILPPAPGVVDGSSPNNIQTRSDFPETWLFEDIEK